MQYFCIPRIKLHDNCVSVEERIIPLCFHHGVVIVPYQQPSPFLAIDMANELVLGCYGGTYILFLSLSLYTFDLLDLQKIIYYTLVTGSEKRDHSALFHFKTLLSQEP